MKLLTNVTIYDFNSFRKNSYVLFDKQIQETGNMSDLPKGDYDIIDGLGQLVLPGLVCAHTHFYSAFARGLSVPFNPKNFQDILDQLWWKLDSQLTLEGVYHSALSFGSEMIQNGITTVIDHHASGQIRGSLDQVDKAITKDLGMRGIFCFETSDRFSTSECLKENNDFIDLHQTNQSSGLFGMHASMSLSNRTLKRIQNETTAPIHVHVAESQMDEEISITKYQKRVVERLQEFDLLRKDSLLVHATHVNDDELDLLDGKEVSIVVNVSSNMNNGVGLPDVKKFMNRHIPVLIGNDGLSPSMTSEYLALYYSMHLKYLSPTAFTLEDLKQIILNNYEYVSRRLKIKIGRIDTGYASDLLLIPYKEITSINESNAFGHLFFGLFHAFKPSNVFIAGRRVLENYKHPIAITENLELSKEVSKKIHQAIQEEDRS